MFSNRIQDIPKERRALTVHTELFCASRAKTGAGTVLSRMLDVPGRREVPLDPLLKVVFLLGPSVNVVLANSTTRNSHETSGVTLQDSVANRNKEHRKNILVN